MATEKRLIDANALSESVSGIGKDMKRPRAVELVCLCLIAEAPTVDAVEVVRCKDCKHYSRDEMFGVGYCYGAEKKLDDFCSYGERKDNDI